MFKDVQKLMLAEAEVKLQALKAEKESMRADVVVLRDKIWDYERKLETLQLNEKHKTGEFRNQNILVLKRIFSAKTRKAYKKYQAALAELKTLPDRISKLTSEMEIAEKQVDLQINTSGILQKIEAAEYDYYHKDMAQCLGELNLSPAEAIKLLENHDITPVLDESDYATFERPREYATKGKAALCAVHKMDIMPENNRISTIKEAGVMQNEKIQIDGKEYEYSYLLERDTVHLSMNDEVSSHNWGNWDNCHYCILQPMAEIPSDKIGSLEPNDTYTRGGVDLTQNAWILCPAAEVETVKELNPGVNVMGYKSENAKGLAAPFLSQLGYRAEKVGMWGWDDHESEQQFYQIAEREKLDVVQHTDSTDYEDEEFNIGINKAIAIVKMLVDNHLIQSASDLERLAPQLKTVDFNDMVGKIFAQTSFSSKSRPIAPCAIVGNRRNLEVLAAKMQRAGIPLSNTDQANLQHIIDHYGKSKAADVLGVSPCEYAAQVLANSVLRARTMEADRTL